MLKEAEIGRREPSEVRLPITTSVRASCTSVCLTSCLRTIANNAEIDVIWEDFQKKLEPLREKLNSILGIGMGGVGDSARGGRPMARASG